MPCRIFGFVLGVFWKTETSTPERGGVVSQSSDMLTPRMELSYQSSWPGCVSECGRSSRQR